MNVVGIISLVVSASGLIVTLVTVGYKLSNAINRSAITGAESRAELTQSTKDLQRSLDEFKTTSREEHAEFHKELDNDRVQLAKQGAEIEAHEKTLNNHENRLTLLERRRKQ